MKYQTEYQFFKAYLDDTININRYQKCPLNIRNNLIDPVFQRDKDKLDELIDSTRSQLNNYIPNREIPTSEIALFTALKLLFVLNGFDDVFSLDEVLIVGGSQLLQVERNLIDRLFEHEKNKQNDEITKYGTFDTDLVIPDKYHVMYPVDQTTDRDIDLLVSFQAEIDKPQPKPIFIPKLVEDWPACDKWRSLDYWMNVTIRGKRSVPIEIGRTYLEDDWTQKIMTFKEFIDNYLLTSDQPGYMAQHDLIHHITELDNDILIPDICHVDTSRHQYPRPQAVALYVNTWIGPKHSISPLHHDPYFNLYCQVVGYKYIRLYPPGTTNMYPKKEENMNGRSIDMSNTSNVDISRDFKDKYPEFPWSSGYQEVIVGPGDCLFIPRGWWHYIESLTQSISMSLWF